MNDEGPSFTGERLHEDDALFGVDLVRHRVAYDHAIRIARESGANRILELGSGTGYGASEIARALPEAVEHLEDPKPYLEAMADCLAEGGVAIVTTPNRLFSDGENPFHVREYEAQELARVLAAHFESVEMLGVSARGEALAYHEARLERIRRIVRIDPLGLRRILPRAIVEALFAKLAVVVRRAIAKGTGESKGLPEVGFENFPIEPAHPRSLDLLALCRRPIRP
jgi:hypothetical protein